VWILKRRKTFGIPRNHNARDSPLYMYNIHAAAAVPLTRLCCIKFKTVTRWRSCRELESGRDGRCWNPADRISTAGAKKMEILRSDYIRSDPAVKYNTSVHIYSGWVVVVCWSVVLIAVVHDFFRTSNFLSTLYRHYVTWYGI